jgi:hypothetical protein
MADVQHDFSRTYVCPLAGLGRGLLDQVYGEMITEARRVLAADGFSPGDQVPSATSPSSTSGSTATR